MQKCRANNIDLILFDLGGVLVELGEHPFPPEWLTGETDFTLKDWFTSSIAIDFETGQISAEKFAQELINTLDLNVQVDVLISAFTAWPKTTFPETKPLLECLRTNYKLGVLSNSNELHWPRVQNEFQISQYFDFMFSSHIIRSAKPDASAFKYVLDYTGFEPQKILFFDDNLANVTQAKTLGIQAALVNGATDVSSYLTANELW